jgi:hypothetical protein
VGLEYDSNVPLETQDKNVQAVVGQKADGRFTFTAGGRYSPVHTETFSFTVGYDFFQSIHFDLHEFDLQNHRAGAQVAGRVGDFRMGFLGRYDYYLLDFGDFLQEVTGYPWASYVFPGGETEVFFRFRYRDFRDADFQIRDAYNFAPGVRQVIEIVDPARFVYLGYRYDREDPTGSGFELTPDGQLVQPDAFAYNGHEVDVGISWLFPWEVTGEAAYAYRHERYDDESEQPSTAIIFRERRIDNEHHFTAVASRPFLDLLRVRLAYFGTINDSNQNEFQYDRHIASISLEVRY